MKTKIILISTLVIAELIVIFLLGTEIYNNQNGSAMIINPIKKENIIFSGDRELKHFYEPLPGSNQVTPMVPRWLSYEPVYTINSDTLNDGSEYQIDKPKDTYRIITLGDSFTFGIYVNTFDSYPETLERLLNNTPCENINKFEVINLGVQGYDIQYSVERFKRRGAKYDPDLVVWLLHDGDFYKIQKLVSARLQSYTNQGGDVAKKAGQEILRELKELGEKKILQYQKAVLYSIKDYYKKNLTIYSLANWLSGEPKKIVEYFAQSAENIHLYEGQYDIEMLGGIFPDGHFNVEGNNIVANDIFEYLTKNNVIPCD